MLGQKDPPGRHWQQNDGMKRRTTKTWQGITVLPKKKKTENDMHIKIVVEFYRFHRFLQNKKTPPIIRDRRQPEHRFERQAFLSGGARRFARRCRGLHGLPGDSTGHSVPSAVSIGALEVVSYRNPRHGLLYELVFGFVLSKKKD